MRVASLLSPGQLSMGVKLRTEAAKAISAVQMAAARTPGGKTRSAITLAAFFTDCASKLTPLTDGTAPTNTTRVVENAAPTKIVLAFSEPMDQTVAPLPSAFAVTGTTRTVTAVAWGTAGNAGKLEVTVNTAFANGNTINIAYTKPAANFLRDPAGNALAAFTAAAVTNNVA